MYASILFGVLTPVSVFSAIGVKAASAFRNSATWSSVALSTSVDFAASSFSNTASTASCAFNASYSLALSPAALTAAALAFAASNSAVKLVYAVSYALTLS